MCSVIRVSYIRISGLRMWAGGLIEMDVFIFREIGFLPDLYIWFGCELLS
jgi:hypothetical protein